MQVQSGRLLPLNAFTLEGLVRSTGASDSLAAAWSRVRPENARRNIVVVALLVELAAGVSACFPDASTPETLVATVDCQFQEGTAGRSVLGLAGARPTAFLDGPTGVAISSHEIALYDLEDGRISVVDRDSGNRIATFGRIGDGPGEFAAPHRALLAPGGPAAWILSWGDSIGVFDGRRMQVFTPKGDVLSIRDLASLAGPRIGVTTRVAAWSGQVLFDRRSASVERSVAESAARGRSFELLSLQRNVVSQVAHLELPSLPKLPNGSTYEGFAEARPSWSLHESCFALTDGFSGTVIVGNLNNSIADTLRLRLPERVLDASAERQRAAALLGVNAGDVPEPSRRSRVVSISLDPTGWLWLEPVRGLNEAKGVEVWRYDLRGGALVIDTVLAFPSHFDSDGTGFGVFKDSLGARSLVTVVRR